MEEEIERGDKEEDQEGKRVKKVEGDKGCKKINKKTVGDFENDKETEGIGRRIKEGKLRRGQE